MPRIEITPNNWEGSEDQLQGNGTPTEDVCRGCANHINIGDDPFDHEIKGYKEGENTITSFDVDAPPYEDTTYECAVCGEKLDADDD
jgi:hypothetical protein